MDNAMSPPPALNEQQISDLKFKCFAQLTAVSSILAHVRSDAGTLDDPALVNAVDFLQRHTGGVIYGIAKQIFPQQNVTLDEKLS